MAFFDFISKAGDYVLDSVGLSDDEKKTTVEKQLKKHGIGEGVSVEINGETIKLGGQAPNQEEMEKIILAVGNGKGVAQVESDIAVDDGDVTEPVFYTVERGDTLSKIAKEHYGSANKYMTIFNANKPMLSDPDKIYPGQKLRIPAMD